VERGRRGGLGHGVRCALRAEHRDRGGTAADCVHRSCFPIGFRACTPGTADRRGVSHHHISLCRTPLGRPEALHHSIAAGARAPRTGSEGGDVGTKPARVLGGVVTATRTGDGVIVTALGSTAVLAVSDPEGLDGAERVLCAELAAIDAACSRFRADSELSRLHARAGSPVMVGALLAEAITAAFRAAELTDGMVDPTVGRAVLALGYDRDFARVAPVSPEPVGPVGAAPGWRQVGWDPVRRQVTVPAGVVLDLGATAKALAADRIAVRAAELTGCGVLVSLGGDVRAAGPAPADGWRLGIGDDHEQALEAPDALVTITGGGLATSGVGRRSWRRAGRVLHHIVDPRTGDSASVYWRSATVAAATCVDANIASTASIVMGAPAVDWLQRRRLPARLVAADGPVVTTAGWAPDGRG
jgi:thiamine biosynthesis lipoprotein